MIVPRLGSGLRRTGRIACERPTASMWTLLAVAAALFAVGVAALAADHVDRWTRATRGSASMVVYLGDGVDEELAAALAGELARLPGVERAELVAATESAARLQRALGADAALLDGVELASLPASVEVTLAPGVRDVIAMSPTVRALRGTEGVDDIVVEDAGADRVASTMGTVRLVAWTGALLLGVVALFVALAAIRVRFDRGEREIAVAHMLGASPLFLVVPSALAGALHGGLAALVAVIALHVGLALYGAEVIRALHGAFGAVELVSPSALACAVFVALGAGLGFVGGGLGGTSHAVR